MCCSSWCVQMLEIEESDFIRAGYSSLSDIHECLSGLIFKTVVGPDREPLG